jgi:SpoIID/LytB domain protein
MLSKIIVICLLLFAYGYSQNLFDAEPEVRVRIINSLNRLEIVFHRNWDLFKNGSKYHTFDDGNKAIIEIEDGNIVIKETSQKIATKIDRLYLSSSEESATITIGKVPYGEGWWWEGKEDRIYEGKVSLYINTLFDFDVIVSLPMEEYLKGVIPYEIGNDAPLEALKAQAIAARSEAVMGLRSKLYGGKYHDLTSDVECQVFCGNQKRTALTDLAVDATKGLILAENDQPINAYYSSNCGGHSELVENVWPDRSRPLSYQLAGIDWNNREVLDLREEDNVRRWIISEPHVYCNPNLKTELPSWSKKNFRWKREFDGVEFSKRIDIENKLGKLLDIKVLKRGISGRINLARFLFDKDSIEVKGELALRQLWQPSLRSACFVVDQKGGRFILSGAGWGHGVGMCQSGAVAQAIQNKSFRDILWHYYQKAIILSLY